MARFAAWVMTAALCGCNAPGLGEVSFNQGVKRVLSNVAPGDDSLVAGRDGLLVVEGGAGAEVSFGDGREPLVLEGDSLRVPGERVGAARTWTLRLPGAQAQEFDVGAAVTAGALRVVLVPFAYAADGSSRVPALGAAELERFRARLLGLFPVSAVELSVHDVVPFAGAMDSSGGGWSALGFELFKLRQAEAPREDTYYFGVVNPAASLDAYCDGACLVGLTVWNDAPQETGKVELRLAVGVGFPEVAADSAAHELGHAHGLRHAPCGSAVEPSTIDARFPHADGGIGVTGYDIASGARIPAEGATDLMGYCAKRWISDYHFAKLLQRGEHVNASALLAAPSAYEVIRVDEAGAAHWERETLVWASASRCIFRAPRSAQTSRRAGWASITCRAAGRSFPARRGEPSEPRLFISGLGAEPPAFRSRPRGGALSALRRSVAGHPALGGE